MRQDLAQSEITIPHVERHHTHRYQHYGIACQQDYWRIGGWETIPVRSKVLLKHAYVIIKKGPNNGWKLAIDLSVSHALVCFTVRRHTCVVKTTGIQPEPQVQHPPGNSPVQSQVSSGPTTIAAQATLLPCTVSDTQK